MSKSRAPSSITSSARLPKLAPGALPIVGHMLAYQRDPLRFLLNTAAQGPATLMRLGPLDAVLLREPEDIERVLLTDHKRFIKDRATRGLRLMLGDGLLTAEGEDWLRHRRLLAPAFHRDRISTYASDMVEAAEQFAREITPGATLDLHAEMMRLTLHIVVRALFDSEVSGETADVSRAIDVLVESLGDGYITLFPWLERLPLPSIRRFHEARRKLDDVLLGIVRARRTRGGAGTDLLSMLLAAQDEAGKGLSDREMRDELMTLFLAGHETTALALSFALVLLARSPEATTRLRKELAEVVGDRSPTADDVPRLGFTRAVVLEAMRIHPPAWAIGREALEDVVVGEHLIRKGEQVWMAQWVNHRDERFFPEPERFAPERWLGGLERSLPRFAYYPFGGGPRICIGNAFAMMEAVLVLATLLHRLDIECLDDAPIELSPVVTLRPKHPIPVKVSPRCPDPSARKR